MQLVHRAEATHLSETEREELVKRLAKAFEARGLGEFAMEYDEFGGLLVMINETRSDDPPDAEIVEEVVTATMARY